VGYAAWLNFDIHGVQSACITLTPPPCLPIQHYTGTGMTQACSHKNSALAEGRATLGPCQLKIGIFVNYIAVNKYVGPPHCEAEMYAGRVVCCPLVSHGEYADGSTDGLTTSTLRFQSARRGQRNKMIVCEIVMVCNSDDNR